MLVSSQELFAWLAGDLDYSLVGRRVDQEVLGWLAGCDGWDGHRGYVEDWDGYGCWVVDGVIVE